MRDTTKSQKEAAKRRIAKILLDSLEGLFLWVFRREDPNKKKADPQGGKFGGGGSTHKF